MIVGRLTSGDKYGMHIQHENKVHNTFIYKKKYTKNCGEEDNRCNAQKICGEEDNRCNVQQIVGKKTTGATANDYKRKSIESWVWRKHLAICRGYKTQTAFLNLQTWLLNAQEVWHSTNTAPAMVHGQPEYPYLIWQPSIEMTSSIRHLGTKKLCGLCSLNRQQYLEVSLNLKTNRTPTALCLSRL